MWLKVLRKNISQFARRAKDTIKNTYEGLHLLPRRSTSVEHRNGNGNSKGNKTNINGAEINRNDDQNSSADKSQAKKVPSPPGGGPLLQQTEISSSQLDFFRMLDEKIENGPDYDESLDAAARDERLTAFQHRWELASVSWSSVASLNTASSSTMPVQVSNTPRSSISSKDREGMRNIVGGRPESAPIYVENFSARSANRVDGLQDIHHCPSPNIPRRVLESITQSPTQTQKTVAQGASPTAFRYQDYEYKKQNSFELGPQFVKKDSYGKMKSIPSRQQIPVNGETAYRDQYLQQTGITGPLQSTTISLQGESPPRRAYVLPQFHGYHRTAPSKTNGDSETPR